MIDKQKYTPYLIEDCVNLTKPYLDLEDENAPYFEFGTYLELLNQVQIKDLNQKEKYPLIWLVWDGGENTENWREDYIYEINCRLFFCYPVQTDLTTRERYEQVLIPKMYPLVDEFIRQIKCHKNIETGTNFRYPTKIHTFWISGANQQTTDSLTAIEIRLENLLIYKLD